MPTSIAIPNFLDAGDVLPESPIGASEDTITIEVSGATAKGGVFRTAFVGSVDWYYRKVVAGPRFLVAANQALILPLYDNYTFTVQAVGGAGILFATVLEREGNL